MNSFFDISSGTNYFTLRINGIDHPLIMGDCYRDGYIVQQDINLAIKYYLDAANNGFSEAWFRLGKLYEMNQQQQTAIRHYQKGIENDACKSRLLELIDKGNLQAKAALMECCPPYKAQEQKKEADATFKRAEEASFARKKPDEIFCLYLHAFQLGRSDALPALERHAIDASIEHQQKL